MSAYRIASCSSASTMTSPSGLTTIEWPYAWYDASGLREGEHMETKIWLSIALYGQLCVVRR